MQRDWDEDGELRKATAVMIKELTMSTVADTIMDVIKVWYKSSDEVLRDPIFHIVREAIIDVVLQGRLGTLLVRKVDKLAESDRFMDTLTQLMVSTDDMISLKLQFMKRRMEKLMNSAVWNAYFSVKRQTTEWFVQRVRRNATRYRRRWQDHHLNQNPTVKGSCAVNAKVEILRSVRRELDQWRLAKNTNSIWNLEKKLTLTSLVQARMTLERWEATNWRSGWK